MRPGCSASGSSRIGSSTASQEPALTETVVEALGRMGDRVVGTIRDRLVDPDTPAATRHELPAALQAIGSPAAQAVLMESLLAGDTVLRMRVISALNKLVQLHPDRRLDRQIVETALAAEITGHYRSYQMLATMGASITSAEPIVQALRESLGSESERIFRLLKILHPEHDLHSAFVGIQSEDADVHDNALEFLDNILAPHVRALVVPLFDRGISAEERARTADRVVGVAIGTRDEAIAVMAQSQDPWLQSCAAYAIGELRLAALRRRRGQMGAHRRSDAARHRAGRARQAEGSRRLPGGGRRLTAARLTCRPGGRENPAVPARVSPWRID